MNRQQNNRSELPQKWEKNLLEEALKLARIYAAKAARKRRMAAADRDDLIQDILLALLQASAHFDPARGSWGGFVTIIARRAIADQARRPSAPPSISLDSKEAAGILRSLAAPAHDPEAPPSAHARGHRQGGHRGSALEFTVLLNWRLDAAPIEGSIQQNVQLDRPSPAPILSTP